jgi:hypothetical protein
MEIESLATNLVEITSFFSPPVLSERFFALFFRAYAMAGAVAPTSATIRFGSQLKRIHCCTL